MERQSISVQLLKRVAYGEDIDKEAEIFLEEISRETSEKGPSLPQLSDYSSKTLSEYIRKIHGMETTPQEIEGFYKQIEEISKEPLTQRKKAEIVFDTVNIIKDAEEKISEYSTKNSEKEDLENRKAMLETLKEAISSF